MSIESDLKEWDGEFPKKENNKQKDKEYLELIELLDVEKLREKNEQK